MKAIKITIIRYGEAIDLGRFVEYINLDEDVAAIQLSRDMAFVAAASDGALLHVYALVDSRFNEYEIENIK